MAVITLSLTGAGSISPVAKTLSAGNTTRLLAAYTKRLQAQGVVSPTPQQCFNHIATQLLSLISNEILNQERLDVQNAVVDIEFI